MRTEWLIFCNFKLRFWLLRRAVQIIAGVFYVCIETDKVSRIVAMVITVSRANTSDEPPCHCKSTYLVVNLAQLHLPFILIMRSVSALWICRRANNRWSYYYCLCQIQLHWTTFWFCDRIRDPFLFCNKIIKIYCIFCYKTVSNFVSILCLYFFPTYRYIFLNFNLFLNFWK